MQVDFNPIPASRDLMTADASPPGGGGLAKVSRAKGGQSDGGRGQQGVGRHKDFHETMDEVLRPEASGRGEGQDLEVSEEAPGEAPAEVSDEVSSDEASEEVSDEVSDEGSNEAEVSPASIPEGTLVEIAATPVDTHQKAIPEWIKAEQGPGSQSEAPLKGALPQGDAAPEFFADKADSASPQLANADMATALEGTADAAATAGDNAVSSTPEAQKPGEPSTSQVKGDLPGKAADPKVHVVSAGAEADTISLAEVDPAARKGGDPSAANTRIWMDGGGRSSTTQAGAEARAGQSFAEGGQSDLPQDASNPQGITKAASASTIAPSAPEEGQPQNFASLVEGLEKIGGEGKSTGTTADTPMDGVAPSDAKGHPISQSTAVHEAKAEPAPSQALPKDAVVQQIVDSARLRLVNGQSEMRIQLKPEHLGRVQLKIATEQQQVVVKVMAELPVVKELLESNLHQLRTELQGQGLEIHKFDVSVGSDAGSQNREPQTWGQHRSGHRGGGFAQSEPDQGEGGSESRAHRPQVATRSVDGVDYFA